MRTQVAADDLYRTEGRRNNGHDKEVRHDGPVPTLTPVHQQESSSLAPDASQYSPIYEGGCLALFGKGLMGRLGYLGKAGSSFGFDIGIGLVCLCNGDDHAPWIMMGHLVGK